MSRNLAEDYVNVVGSNIQAIGTRGYVMVEPVDPNDEEAWHRINRIAVAFGDVTHLKHEIIAYLHKLGRMEEI